MCKQWYLILILFGLWSADLPQKEHTFCDLNWMLKRYIQGFYRSVCLHELKRNQSGIFTKFGIGTFNFGWGRKIVVWSHTKDCALEIRRGFKWFLTKLAEKNESPILLPAQFFSEVSLFSKKLKQIIRIV
jgi:hypothetical protein